MVFSHDPSENINAEFTVSVRGTNLIKVHGNELNYSIPRGIRLGLTNEERQLVVESMVKIFSVGRYDSVINYIGDVHSWYISSETCRFCGIYGSTYINTKSYHPQIIGRLPKKE